MSSRAFLDCLMPAAVPANWDCGTPLSLDVFFTPVESVTDLVSISAGSVYTGEAASLMIQAIASDDAIYGLFPSTFLSDFFQTKTLASITNNTFTDFASPHDSKGLRFTWSTSLGSGPRLRSPRDGVCVCRGARTRCGNIAGLRPGRGLDRPPVYEVWVCPANALHKLRLPYRG